MCRRVAKGARQGAHPQQSTGVPVEARFRTGCTRSRINGGTVYVAVSTGEGQSGNGNVPANVPKLKPVHGHNAVYMFALPDKR